MIASSLRRLLGLLRRSFLRWRRRHTQHRRLSRLRKRVTHLRDVCHAAGRMPTAVLLLERFGDIVACSGLVGSLRSAANRYIVWVGRNNYREVARRIPGVDDYLVVDCYGDLRRLLPAIADWQVVDLNLNGKTCACCGEPWRNLSGDRTTNTENYYDHGPLVVSFARGLQLRGPAPQLTPSASARLPDGLVANSYAIVHSESEEAARGWQPDGWMQLVGELSRSSGLRVVHVGARPAPWAARVPDLLDLGGATDVDGLLALVENCALFVGIDSSIAHIANAYRRPGLVLLGRYRVFPKYMPYTGYYGEREAGALIVRYWEESIHLPMAVVSIAIDTSIRRWRSGRGPLGRGGPWDVREVEFAAEPLRAETAEQAVIVLTNGDAAAWARAWVQCAGSGDDAIWALPLQALATPAAEHGPDVVLEEIEAHGGRFAVIVAEDQQMAPSLSASHRCLRVGGKPVVLCEREHWVAQVLGESQATPVAVDAGDGILAADQAIQWILVDGRRPDVDRAAALARASAQLAALRAARRHDPESGQLLAAVGDGCEASVDSVERHQDGSLARVSGWAFVRTTGRPPDHLALAVHGEHGYRLLQTARFPRLDRPDVARARGIAHARFSGWSFGFPRPIVAPRSALALLARNAADGSWHRIPLPPP